MNEDHTTKPRMPGIKNFPLLGPVVNEVRTHLSLHNDAPVPREVQAGGHVLSVPILGGLHHQYDSSLSFRQAQGTVVSRKSLPLPGAGSDPCGRFAWAGGG